jgi:hypothetical protein
MKPEINWAREIYSVDMKNYQLVEKQVEVEGTVIDYRVNILNKNSPNLVVNIPGIGDNGIKDLQYYMDSFESSQSKPFFNVITFSNPKPYTPETVTNGVFKILTDVKDDLPNLDSIILHAYSQGAVATWSLLNNGILEDFSIKGIVLQVPIINLESVSGLFKKSTDRFQKLIEMFVRDPEKWRQEMKAVIELNNTLNQIVDTPTLLIRFDKDRIVDNVSVEKIIKKSFTNFDIATFSSSRKMIGHDTDDWSSVMKTEVKFMADCFSLK